MHRMAIIFVCVYICICVCVCVCVYCLYLCVAIKFTFLFCFCFWIIFRVSFFGLSFFFRPGTWCDESLRRSLHLQTCGVGPAFGNTSILLEERPRYIRQRVRAQLLVYLYIHTYTHTGIHHTCVSQMLVTPLLSMFLFHLYLH